MPWYDYKCPKCGTVQEFNHKIDEKSVYFCDCDLGVHMVKQFNPVPSHFKGTGFYQTDYKDKK